MRRLEQRTYYPPPADLYDEWYPFEEVDTRYMTDEAVKQFVREWNKQAKLRGDYTRLRSVDVDDE